MEYCTRELRNGVAKKDRERQSPKNKMIDKCCYVGYIAIGIWVIWLYVG